MRALYGGSFDPVHLGHVSVIEGAARGFDELAVVVLGNPAKSSGLFPPHRRVELLARCTRGMGNVTVHVHHGLIADAAVQLGADVLLRTTHKEGRNEQAMAAANRSLSGIPTVFVVPEPATSWISSTMVRRLWSEGHLEDITGMVPRPVREALGGQPHPPGG